MRVTESGEPVWRVRAGGRTGTDRYGNPIHGPDVVEPLPTALFDPGGSRESREPGRAPVISEPALYFRGAFPDLSSGDRVRVRDLVYAVEGDPAVWIHPGRRTDGTVVQLRRVTG